jgi:hypothetical protein
MPGLPPLKNHRFLADDLDGDVYLNFGAHKGELLSVVAEENPSYLEWLLDGGVELDEVSEEYIEEALGA